MYFPAPGWGAYVYWVWAPDRDFHGAITVHALYLWLWLGARSGPRAAVMRLLRHGTSASEYIKYLNMHAAVHLTSCARR